MFVFIVSSIACAEIDITNVTFDELLKARELITQAIWATDEWQEVEVPAGLYQIGVDIPAGYWTIKTNSYYATMIKYGNFLNKNKNEIDYPYVWDYIELQVQKSFITIAQQNYLGEWKMVIFFQQIAQ